jgi:hypothetical protein
MGARRQSVVSGQDRGRASCAGEGEARHHQFRIGRLRQPAAHRGRDVHTRRQHPDDARALSRADPRHQRSRRRARLGDVHRSVDGDGADSGRPAARAGVDEAGASAAASQRSDHGGIRPARLRLRHLGGIDAAPEDAAGDRRQAQRRRPRHPEGPGGPRPADRARIRRRRQHAGAADRLHAPGIHPNRRPHPRREYPRDHRRLLSGGTNSQRETASAKLELGTWRQSWPSRSSRTTSLRQ